MKQDDFFEKNSRATGHLALRGGGGHRVRNTVLVSVGIILALGIIVGLIVLMTKTLTGPRVPDVVGMSYDEAAKKVESANLEIRVDPLQDSSGECGNLRVEEQDPKPGADVEEGEVVTVRLEGLHDSAELLKDEGSVGAACDEQELPAEEVPAPTPGSHETAPHTSASDKIVCLDPGHSANSPSSEIDEVTGLDVADNSGASGEREAMWELAQVTKHFLEREGYQVRLTKQSQDEYASLRTRADIGNTCSIMVRLHFDPNLHAVLYPVEGQYKKRGDSIVYVQPQVAASSAELAQALFTYLQVVGVTKIRSDCGGTSNNSGPAFVGSVLSTVPVVLIENDPDMVLENPSGQEQVARAITDGINAYFRTGSAH